MADNGAWTGAWSGEMMAKATKGYIENLASGGTLRFQYNPETFNDKHATTFSEIKAPGLSYPRLQFVGGNTRMISFKLLVDATDWPRDDLDNSPVRKTINFLNDFEPVANQGDQFTLPPQMIFAFGWFVKHCLMYEFDTDYLLFTPGLQPLRAEITLNLAIIQ